MGPHIDRVERCRFRHRAGDRQHLDPINLGPAAGPAAELVVAGDRKALFRPAVVRAATGL